MHSRNQKNLAAAHTAGRQSGCWIEWMGRWRPVQTCARCLSMACTKHQGHRAQSQKGRLRGKGKGKSEVSNKEGMQQAAWTSGLLGYILLGTHAAIITCSYAMCNVAETQTKLSSVLASPTPLLPPLLPKQTKDQDFVRQYSSIHALQSRCAVPVIC